MQFDAIGSQPAALPNAELEYRPETEDPLGGNRLETNHRDAGWSRFNRSGATVLHKVGAPEATRCSGDPSKLN
jgi:hypothetical protein